MRYIPLREAVTIHELGRTIKRADGPPTFGIDEAITIGEAIGIDWDTASFDPEAFQMGLEVELEHGTLRPETDVTGDDPEVTGKIAWAHLLESPDYYIMLADMEEQMPPEEEPVTAGCGRDHDGVVTRSPSSGVARAVGSLGVAANTLHVIGQALLVDAQRADAEECYVLTAQAQMIYDEEDRLLMMAEAIEEGTLPPECCPCEVD